MKLNRIIHVLFIIKESVMKVKHLIPFAIVFSLVLPITSFATSWAYSFVVWDGYIYVVSNEYVTDVDSEIGQVTKYSDMEQYSGNFSNVYEKGTKYYSIEATSTDEAIAIQEDDGEYKKAIREAEYTYVENKHTDENGSTVFIGSIIGLLVLFLIALLSIYFVKKRMDK